jgi:hypothetical protein
MKIRNMYYLVIPHISKVAIILLAAGTGEALSIVDEHPAIISVLAGTIAALAIKYVDKWLEGRNKTIKTADEVLKIEDAKAERLEKQAAELLAEKEAWYKTQNDRIKAEYFEKEQRWLEREEHFRRFSTEAMEINHSANSELMKQQRIILGLQREMILKGLTVPDVTILEITKYMLPAWELEKEENEKQYITMDTEPQQTD